MFRSLLAFRIDSGDKELTNHINNCNKCKKRNKYFSILCDETTNISTKEQMTFLVRYIDMEEIKIKEEFLGVIQLNSTTVFAFCYQLSLKNFRGQGYDGGSNMSGRNNGVQALILRDQPLAHVKHKLLEIWLVLLALYLTSSSKKKLKALCAIRWVERHDSIITFRKLYAHIVITLEELKKMPDSETTCKAVTFSASIKRSEFLISLEIVANLFSYTKMLSPQNIRENSTSRFETYFKNASDIAALVCEDIIIPRLCGRQTTRCNIQTTDPME
ncbi:zinc finger MYM-type protein 1-like [Aphis craccivora]|uniref:Zinc finger MYM-type protein 1-like n=1 Tax=Aphis craccivora TaxID=307492 RepID=A0A6G0YL86_APHCR|nr:zinc finger MYM-type protein 1-like [Aphis craccivora]